MSDTKPEYIVLARKYRPQKFSDILGQEDIASVIQGAIQLKRVPHAFIFSGTRGVGKTTFARVLAKILNCTDVQENINPCGKCKSCKSIDSDSNMDVVEIDAASRTGVADVREIIENINYKPVSAKKKIFIIDEVHMLSKAAFNALLKTLEEPPKDVVFIFATTETEKIPVTILSRCQKFFLQRVNLESISQHLIKVAKKEGYSLDDESSKIISRCSEGSVRDALSILENVLAHNSSPSPDNVRKVLGLANFNTTINLFRSLCLGDVESSINQFNHLYKQGISIDQLAKSLLNISYNFSLIKSGVSSEENLNDSEITKNLVDMKNDYEMDFIIRFWELLQKYMNELSDVFDEKQCFEMTIMRLCYASLVPTPFEIIKSQSIEKKITEKINVKSISPETSSEKSLVEKNQEFTNDNLARENFKESKFEPQLKQESDFDKFSNLVNLIEKRSEMVIAFHLKNSFKLVRFFEPKSNKSAGSIVLENISKKTDFKKILWDTSKLLENITKKRWVLSISNETGMKSISQVEKEKSLEKIELLKKEKLLKKILEIIPSSEILSIKAIEKNTIKDKK